VSAERDDNDNGGTDIDKHNDPGATHYYGDGCDDDHGRADHPLAIPNVHHIVINDAGEYDEHDDKLDSLIDRAVEYYTAVEYYANDDPSRPDTAGD
jgi:hypothetical protein